MRTLENIMGIEHDRTKVRVTRRVVAVRFALVILALAAGAPRLTHVGASSNPPVRKCSDFACEQ